MPESEKAPVSAVTEISFCPHLQLYHYKRADGADYLFDTLKLEEAIESYLKQGDTRQADFMVALTGVARQFPHQVATFDKDGKCVLRDLKPVATPGQDDKVG